MKIIRLVRRLLRAVTPPGNRGSIDSSYRQPNITGTNVSSPMSDHDRGWGGTS
jgi:hypothetical protein